MRVLPAVRRRATRRMGRTGMNAVPPIKEFVTGRSSATLAKENQRPFAMCAGNRIALGYLVTTVLVRALCIPADSAQ